MRDEQHPNQDEANIPDQNKQTDSLEESLREYQERKRQEFQLNISGLDDIGDESPEIYSKPLQSSTGIFVPFLSWTRTI